MFFTYNLRNKEQELTAKLRYGLKSFQGKVFNFEWLLGNSFNFWVDIFTPGYSINM